MAGTRLLSRLWLALRQGLGASLRWGEVQRALAPTRPSSPYWTLSMVGVDIAAQGRGIGRQLVAGWLEHVASDAADAWVETDRPELLSFYRGFDFEVEAESSIFGVTVYGMRRPG